MKKRNNPFQTNQNVEIDHKDIELLKRFIRPNGKIKPRRYTGLTPVQQRKMARAIKRARHLALLPFVN